MPWPRPFSEPSAAKRQIPVRYPTRGQRSPSARIALPSRVHVGSTKIESEPFATRATSPDATSTV